MVVIIKKYMEVNYIGTIVVAITSFGFGMLWYSGMLFGVQWRRLSVITKEKEEKMKGRKKGMTKMFFISILSSFAMAIAVSYFLELALFWEGNRNGDANGLLIGLQTGFFLWLGFFATSTIGSVLWENRPWKFWIIVNGYWLLNLLIMGGILGSWR